MPSCAVFQCNVNSRNIPKDVCFHRFPKDQKLAAVWVQLCSRSDKIVIKNAKMCSKHFRDEDYDRQLIHELLGTTPRYRLLKSSAVPSLNLTKEPEIISDSSRSKRSKRRNNKKRAKELQEETEDQAEVDMITATESASTSTLPEPVPNSDDLLLKIANLEEQLLEQKLKIVSQETELDNLHKLRDVPKKRRGLKRKRIPAQNLND